MSHQRVPHNNARIELVAALVRLDDDGLWQRTKREGNIPGPSRTWRRARATESHYLRLVAGNGFTLATSELYANKANAKAAADAWRRAFLHVGFAEARGRDWLREVES